MVSRQLLQELIHVRYEDVIGLRLIANVGDRYTWPFLPNISMPLHELRQLFLLFLFHALLAPASWRHWSAVWRDKLVKLRAGPTITVNRVH